MSPSAETERKDAPEPSSWLASLANYVFGFDFFISYAHADARAYAMALARKLDDQGFECFLDSDDYAAGDDWKQAGRVALRRTSRLLLVASPAALRSGPVLREVETFRERDRRIIPIDVGGALAAAGDTELFQAIGSATIRIHEAPESLDDGPSDDVVNHIRDSFDLTRQHQRRQRVLSAATVIFASLAVLALLLAWQAHRDRRRALEARDRAERETRRVKASELAARSDQARDPFPQRSVLLAVEAIRATKEDGLHIPAAEQALRNRLGRFPANALDGAGDRLTWVDVTADGRWTVARTSDGAVWMWDLTAENPWQTGVELEGRVARRTSMALVTDGRRLAAGGADGRVRLWDLALETPWDESEVLDAHESEVTAVASSLDGHRLATAGRETVRVWDLEAAGGEPTHSLPWSADAVAELILSPDGRWLVGRSDEGTALLWDLRTSGGAAAGLALTEDPETAQEVAMSPDSRWLLVLGDDDTVRSWDLTAGDVAESRTPFSDWEGSIAALAISADSRWLVTPAGGHLVLWDLTAEVPGDSATVLWEWPGLEEDPFPDEIEVSTSADGRWLAAVLGPGDWGLWLLDADEPEAVRRFGFSENVLQNRFSADSGTLFTLVEGRLTRWDLAGPPGKVPSRVLSGIGFDPAVVGAHVTEDAGRLIVETADGKVWLHDTNGDSAKAFELPGHEGRVAQTVARRDSRWLLILSHNRSARLWDLGSVAGGSSPNGDPIRDIDLTSDGRLLFTRSFRQARLWDLERAFPFASPLSSWDGTTVLSEDGRWMASQRRGQPLELWDLQAGRPLEPVWLGPHEEGLFDAEVDVRGDWLILRKDRRRRAWLYDVSGSRPPRPRLVIPDDLELEDLAVSPDGHWLTLRTRDGIAGLMDLTAADPEATDDELPHDGVEVTASAITPDSRFLLTGTVRGEVRLWNLDAADPFAAARDLPGHVDEILRFELSPSGRWMVSVSRDGQALLWDLDVPRPPVRGLALAGGGGPVFPRPFSADDRWLATRGEDDVTRLWDLGARDPAAAPFVLATEDHPIYRVWMLPGDQWMATRDDAGEVRLWDLRAADPASTAIALRGHETEVREVLFTPDGGRLATFGKDDRAIRLWDLRAPDPSSTAVILAGHRNDLDEMEISRDGRWLASLDEGGAVRLWPLRLDQVVDQARRTAGRNLGPGEWGRYFPGVPYRATFPELPSL